MRILETELPDAVVHASAPAGALDRIVLWHPGSPHAGTVLEPVRAAAAAVGRDVVTVARPGYAGTPRRPGRSVAEGAADAIRVLELLDARDVVVVGYSGGGPHAIATAAAAPERTGALMLLASVAPHGDPAWFEGMADPSALRAAEAGAAAREAHPERFEPGSFVARDWAALEGGWSALGADAQAGGETGPLGLVDDDLAFVLPWGAAMPTGARCRIAHGTDDRVVPPLHARLLAGLLPQAALVLHPGDGHVSMLEHLDEHLGALAAG
ncbi:alpha/beta fold hydrolase [Agrococcus sp. SL85]|uniref:alpha/beta fold hydrolase n=1 Tax=Agrococcus sp. SL85 TaxID=2995141 RepID=UPI00226C9675|nr:alpha/beta fold hydrolase [Agrococcus sp. SL85]WAC67250.1 alpha/beta fold hydrolase [Agrococcus sp. SL85]